MYIVNRLVVAKTSIVVQGRKGNTKAMLPKLLKNLDI